MSEKLSINTYPVQVKYFAREADGKGGLCEVEKKTTLNLCRLSRTSIAHTRLGVKMLNSAGDMEAAMDIAVEFVRLTASEEKTAQTVCEDMVACLEILNSKPVQEDIDRFLSTWAFLKESPEEKAEHGN